MSVPVESISAAVLMLVTLYELAWSSIATEFDLRVCGHVYATPPREIYRVVWTVALMVLLSVLGNTFKRCRAVLSGNNGGTESARLFPSVGTDIHSCRVALYTRRWLTLCDLAFNTAMCAVGTWYVGHQYPLALPAAMAMTAIQVLNLFLGLINVIWKPSACVQLENLVKLFTVFSTEREYDNLDLENRSWEYSDISQHSAQREGIVVDAADGKSLFVCGWCPDGFVTSGAWLNGPVWALLPIPSPTSAQADRVNLADFTLIPLRVPYSLVWYSVYELIRVMGAYKGADEIDKCAVWLAFVSALALLVTRLTPGPCVVVKKDAQK